MYLNTKYNMNVTIASLFEEMFQYFEHTILKRAKIQNLWSYKIINLYDIAKSLNMYSIDDIPFGGGNGMILKPIIFDHIDLSKYTHKFYMSPRGRRWTQKDAYLLANKQDVNMFILCGRYEGVDERILQYYNFEEISAGDYVLCGGELPSMMLVESVVRLLPNVIKNNSHALESFNDMLLEHDLYTKPQIWNNIHVPDVLISGHHRNIIQWKYLNSLHNTYTKRIDLFNIYIVFVFTCILTINSK